MRLHNPWPARQAECLLRWWPAGSYPPLEGARWWPAGAPEPVGKAGTNEGGVTRTNTKADTGNMEKAEQGSQQGLIEKQEREVRHITDSDSDTQHTSSKSGTGNTDAPVGANSMDGATNH